MVNYIDTRLSKPALVPRYLKVNEMFLATYDVIHYGGCEFACAYCDGWHFSHTPLDLTITAHMDCPERMRRELPEVSEGEVFGFTKGEPYQPAERQYRITRKLLEVLAEAHRPVVILTKSPMVCEDISILQTIQRRAFAVVVISMVTLDSGLSRTFETRTPAPNERLEEYWYKINAYGGRQLVVWSIPLIILGLVTFFLLLAGKRFWIVMIACAPPIYIVPAIISYLYARQLH